MLASSSLLSRSVRTTVEDQPAIIRSKLPRSGLIRTLVFAGALAQRAGTRSERMAQAGRQGGRKMEKNTDSRLASEEKNTGSNHTISKKLRRFALPVGRW